jgi:2-aminoethylphosphonate transport system ATP-binding protein
MRDGRLKAFGAARSLFRHPPSRFAAEFLGRANLLPVSDLQPIGDGMAQLRFGESLLTARNHHRLPAGGNCLICVRPHDFRFADDGDGPNRITGSVVSVQWQGDVQNIMLKLGGETVRMTSTPMATPPAIGDSVAVCFDAAEVTLVPEDGGNGR